MSPCLTVVSTGFVTNSGDSKFITKINLKNLKNTFDLLVTITFVFFDLTCPPGFWIIALYSPWSFSVDFSIINLYILSPSSINWIPGWFARISSFPLNHLISGLGLPSAWIVKIIDSSFLTFKFGCKSFLIFGWIDVIFKFIFGDSISPALFIAFNVYDDLSSICVFSNIKEYKSSF